MDDLISRQSEYKEIGYKDCANAMLNMWMDEVLTDAEYFRIMKLYLEVLKERAFTEGIAISTTDGKRG